MGLRGVVAALVGSLALAAVSTVGDFVWATWIPEHRAVYGTIHGAVLFGVIGLVLGTLAARPLAGTMAGATLGAVSAGGFYVLAPLVGYSAMFAVWVGAWLAFGLLYARLSRARPGTRDVLARGTIAAISSGLAFYLISGIWRPFDPEGWDYAVHFGAWACAYFPGLAALLVAPKAPALSSDDNGGETYAR